MNVDGAKVIALVPARGGSKGLPGKNVRMLHDRPLIAWTIQSARDCPLIDRVFVSSDDQAIMNAAASAGAEIPFVRPAHLASDSASSTDVILHWLEWMRDSGGLPDIFVLLQPTSPLRTTEDITAALELMQSQKARAVISVCESEHHPWFMNTLPADGNMAGFISERAANAGRQQLPAYYRLNGAIYACESDYFLENRGFYGPQTFASIMPRERSVDIDTLLDFKLAELILNDRLNRKVNDE